MRNGRGDHPLGGVWRMAHRGRPNPIPAVVEGLERRTGRAEAPKRRSRERGQQGWVAKGPSKIPAMSLTGIARELGVWQCCGPSGYPRAGG
jgi:hypothetical protein